MKMKFGVVAFAALALSLSGCGAGKKLVREFDFIQENVQGEQFAGFNAKLNLGIVELPRVVLPLQGGAGRVQIGGDEINLRLNVTQAIKLPIGDGTTLPNGREIPVTLPQGVIPIGIPLMGTNTKVYVAISRTQIMAGVAVSLKSDLGKIGDILGIPMNVFFPFTVSADTKGSAGLYTGDKFGVGVFAVKTIQSSDRGNLAAMSAPAGEFEPKTQIPSARKLRRLNRAIGELKSVQLD